MTGTSTKINTDKLHLALEQALNDLAKVEADPRYQIDMGNWHAPKHLKEGIVCAVCLGGAVIACELPIPPEHSTTPLSLLGDEQISNSEFSTLRALDLLRTGDVAEGVARFYMNRMSTREIDGLLFKIKLMDDYEYDTSCIGISYGQRNWWENMWAIQRYLKIFNV